MSKQCKYTTGIIDMGPYAPLILEFNIDHGFEKAQEWIRNHQDGFSNEDPLE